MTERALQARAGLASLCILGILVAGCTGGGDAPNPLVRPSDVTSPPPSPPAPAPPAPLATPPPAPASPSGSLRVFFVDVGQGDGVIWQLPDGSIVVYDCGDRASSAATNPMVAALRALGLGTGATLHALVASHGHLDHVGGCEEVLQEYRVAHLYEAWYDGTDAPQSYARFRDQLKAEGGTIHVLAGTPALDGEVLFRAGDTLDLPAAAGVRAEFLWPPAFQADRWDRIAESSLAVRLAFGSVDFCLQGDVEAAQEGRMIPHLAGRGCDVYLMGHHGSRHASSADWLAAMRPTVAVASFGENSYGHPTAEALCRVQHAGAKVYATHRLGTIEVSTDGTGVAVRPDQPEAADYCATGVDYWT